MTTFENKRITVIAFNNETESVENGTIQLFPNSRTIHPGASEAGWAYSTNDGVSWTYGGTVPPPLGWSALWSDPGATASLTERQYVFMSFLAIPDAKFPTSGNLDGSVNNFLGGACILRSSDGGQHFDNNQYQCLQSTEGDPSGDFFDGGSMAASPDGAVYASFVDVSIGAIAVYRAPNATAPFVPLPHPFPGRFAATHPRIRIDQATGVLYVMAPIKRETEPGLDLFISRFQGGTWTAPLIVNQSHDPTVRAMLPWTSGAGRASPEYTFDIGTPSQAGHDEIRAAYTYNGALGKLHVQASACSIDLSNCIDPPNWNTEVVPGDQFGPVVRFFDGGPFNAAGPQWKITWLSREKDPDGSTYIIDRANLAVLPNGTRVMIGFPLTGSLLVCPSTSSNYWGDYNDMQAIGVGSDFQPIWIRPYSDSTSGCFEQSAYASWHLHVSAVRF